MKLINIVVKFIYLKSDTIIAQSDSFREHLKKKYNLKHKIYTLFQPSDFEFQKYNYKKNKTHYLTFAGNFGNAQDFDILIKAFNSGKLKKNIKLNLIGSGKQYKNVEEKIKKLKLKNLINLIPYMNKNKLKKILNSSSALVITLKNGKSLNKTIPGKFQTYVSFGKPLLVSSNSVVNSIVSKNKIGFVSKFNDLDQLIYNINKIPNLSENKKKNIFLFKKKVYEQKFDLNKVINKLIYILKDTHKCHAKKIYYNLPNYLQNYIDRAASRISNNFEEEFINSDVGSNHNLNKNDKKTIIKRIKYALKKVNSATSLNVHLELGKQILSLNNKPGYIVECGSFKGASTISLSIFSKIVGKKLIIYDSFEGLPEDTDKHKDRNYPFLKLTGKYKKGMYEGSLDEVKKCKLFW